MNPSSYSLKYYTKKHAQDLCSWRIGGALAHTIFHKACFELMKAEEKLVIFKYDEFYCGVLLHACCKHGIVMLLLSCKQ